MRIDLKKMCFAAAALAAVTSLGPANAYESGSPGTQVPVGIAIGNTTAAAPGPGIYMFDQFWTYHAKIVGPGAPNVGGAATAVNVNAATPGFIFVPGWTFLGATYDAVLVQPFASADTGSPVNTMKTGVHNTFVVPVELSWKLGQSGFFVKTGLGIGVPDGTISGVNGLGNVGNPWWTFRPEFIVSYLNEGWNLTAAFYYETNTRNTVTKYRSGDVLDSEFAVTKQFGKWTLGVLGYYVAQVGDDSSSASYGNAISANRFHEGAIGGLVGYNFGPVQLNVFGFREVSAGASGGSPTPFVTDRAAVTQGYKLFANVSYRLWAPDPPATTPIKPQIFK
jgi:hypothetical protein